MTTVVIAAGGTGGHVFPGLAIADALVARADLVPIFAGTRKGFEERLVPERGYEVQLFDVTAMKGGGVKQVVRGASTAAWSTRSALRFLRARSPRVVIGIGGYAAGPVCLAAAVMGIPVVLVEPNGVMGLSNRVLAPLARRIYLGWGDAAPRFGAAKVRRFGVPIRAGFTPQAYRSSDTRRVLVLGGSQGAQALNDRVPEAVGRLVSEFASIEVVHQTGEGRDAAVALAYTREGVKRARVVPFASRLDEELEWADLVIARAGAGTLAEIAAVGRASILIPYPHAADDHQAKNAAAFAAAGAALAIHQTAADAARLALDMARLFRDGALREQLATHARAEGRPDATARIVEDIMQVARISPRPKARPSSRNGVAQPDEVR